MIVSLVQGRNELQVSATNVSEGGLAICSEDQPIEMGWSGAVEFRIPQGGAAVNAMGEIVWVSGKEGGIRFSHVPIRSRKALDEWLDQRAEEDDLTPKPQQRARAS